MAILMVLRCSTGQHVASMELREEGDRVAAEARALGQYYNWALCGVEANGVGKAVLLELKRLKYPKVYTRWIYDTKVKTQTKKLGWYTTAANKESMLGAMWRLLREGHVTSTEVRFIKEMGEYRRYSDAHGRVIRLGGQPHDDWVMAMAIGVQMLQHLGADYIDRLDDPEELPALTPGRIDYGHGFDGWFKLGSKTTTEQQWKSNTIPKRVRTTSVGNDGAFMRPSELSGSTPRRLTRTGR